MIGNEDDAFDALLSETMPYSGRARQIGRGEARAVYRIGDVAYKITRRNSANEHEHAALTAWREAGAQWAPETTLYHFDVQGAEWVVLAMPYLPHTSRIDPAVLAEIKKAAPQTCAENVTAHGRRTYLIDGGDIEYWPQQ